MLTSLKSEFKKLLTVRSTYIMVILAFCLTAFFSYLGTSAQTFEEPKDAVALKQKAESGQQPTPDDFVTITTRDLPKEKLYFNIQEAISVITLFFTIVVVLFMAHEFRYNTITYTLTSSRSRSKVLASKVTVAIVFTVVVALIGIGITAAATYAAVNIKDLNLPSQDDFNWLYIVGRMVAYVLGTALIFLAITTIARNLVASIVAIFLLPTIEAISVGILSTWEIAAAKVMPFSALGRIRDISYDYMPRDQAENLDFTNTELLSVSVLGATTTFLLYLLGVWAIAWYLFLKRDAN